MKIKISIIGLLAALIIIQGFRVITSSGLAISIDPVSLEHCDTLVGPVGAEDITIDHVNQLAYIGADDRRAYLVDGQPIQENGAIWVLDLKHAEAQAIKLKTSMPGVFHPHGIALRKNLKGEALELYVVNHIDTKNHEIDVFEITQPGVLSFNRRIRFPEMVSPNDLVVVGKDRLFVSNDHASTQHTLMQKMEDYLGLPMSSVVFFDGEKGHIVIDGLRMANGIALSSDQETLYVAETLARQVSRYRQVATLRDWQYQDSVSVEFGVDNLEWGEQGQLLTAGHPKVFDFLAHLNDRSKNAPSEVASIDVSGEIMRAETLYLNSGEQISGASVAAQSGKTLLIGPVIDERFLRCKLN